MFQCQQRDLYSRANRGNSLCFSVFPIYTRSFLWRCLGQIVKREVFLQHRIFALFHDGSFLPLLVLQTCLTGWGPAASVNRFSSMEGGTMKPTIFAIVLLTIG